MPLAPAGNPLKHDQFQLTSSERFCPLPILMAIRAYKMGKSCGHRAFARPLNASSTKPLATHGRTYGSNSEVSASWGQVRFAPDERTSSARPVTSEKCHYRTHAPQQLAPIRSQASPRLFCLHLHRSAEVPDRAGRDHQIAALALCPHRARTAGSVRSR